MKFFGLIKPKNSKVEISKRSFDALAVMLLLTQLPHVLHLPLWVSVFGTTLVALKWFSIRHGSGRNYHSVLKFILSSHAAVFWAILSTLAVKLQYGHFLGRDPSVAFLFLLVACKYAEATKQNDATTLMSLSGFLLLTQYFYSQDILSALLTLPAVISIGVALSVLTEYSTRKLSNHFKLIGKLLIQGAPIAAVLFILFPRLPGPLWSMPDESNATTGLTDSMSPGTIGRLSKTGEVAFRVDFEGKPPEQRELYWRGPVLSNFDGRSWTVTPTSRDVSIQYSSSAKDIAYKVTLQPHYKKWLFALEHPTSLPLSVVDNPASGGLKPTVRADLQILSNEKITKVTQYNQRSLLADRYTPAVLPSETELQLPGRNPKTAAFAKEMRGKYETDAQYATAVLQWFNTQPYFYTLEPSLLGESPVDEFMFQTKNGFCGHYASAYVVMMRAAGIPARVVTGYQGGEMNEHYMIVRQSDAHAWVEAFIDKQWVRFDPTAAVAPSRVNAGLSAALPDSNNVPRMARSGNSWLKQTSLRWDRLNHDWQNMVVNFNNESQSNFWKNLGIPNPQPWQIMTLVLMLAALWGSWVLRSSQPKTKVLTADEKYWQLYCQHLSAMGVVQLDGETGAQLTVSARNQHPEHDELLARLGDAFSVTKFEPIDDEQRAAIHGQLKADLKTLGKIALGNKAGNLVSSITH